MDAISLFLAAATLAPVFADHCVLQRDRPVAVWGMAVAGEEVAVTFGGSTERTKAGPDGRWRVNLPPMPACANGRDLVVVSSGPEQRIADVLVGEVWFLSGQSNAVCPLWYERGVHFRDQQGAMVAQYLDIPTVRFVNGTMRWRRFSPGNLADYEHAAGGDEHSFSALGTYFARELHLALGGGVPIGVIGVYSNGTGIDTWIAPEGYATRDDLDDMRNWRHIPRGEWTKGSAKGPIVAHHQQPSVLFAGRVRRWMPWTVRGVLWHQGASNMMDAPRYTAKLHALWNGWSMLFENPSLPFIYCETSRVEGGVFELVQRQIAFSRENPHAAMVASNDITLPDVHGQFKEPIARRMVLQALRRVYGRSDVRGDSPVPVRATASGRRLTVEFSNARTLYVYNETTDGRECNIELAGEDGVWRPAKIVNFADRKSGGWASDGYVPEPRLVLEAKDVETPVRVRYLVKPPLKGNLYNDAALPSFPFEVLASGRETQAPAH